MEIVRRPVMVEVDGWLENGFDIYIDGVYVETLIEK